MITKDFMPMYAHTCIQASKELVEELYKEAIQPQFKNEIEGKVT